MRAEVHRRGRRSAGTGPSFPCRSRAPPCTHCDSSQSKRIFIRTSIAAQSVGIVVVELQPVTLRATFAILSSTIRALDHGHVRKRIAGLRPRYRAHPDEVSASSRLFLGFLVLPKRLASTRSSFSDTAASMIEARSLPGTRASSRLSLSAKLLARGEHDFVTGFGQEARPLAVFHGPVEGLARERE